jgi:ketosteroid isomerase-like protein
MPVKERVLELVRYVEQGKILEAIEEFYAEDVVMQDNANTPTVGKPANHEREAQFVAFIREVHENRAAVVLVDGEHAVIHWYFEFTGADGKRTRLDQLAFQTWLGDQIVHERFFYDPATLAVSGERASVAA